MGKTINDEKKTRFVASSKNKKIIENAKAKINKLKKDSPAKILKLAKLYDRVKKFESAKVGDIYRYANNTIVVVVMNDKGRKIPQILTKISMNVGKGKQALGKKRSKKRSSKVVLKKKVRKSKKKSKKRSKKRSKKISKKRSKKRSKKKSKKRSKKRGGSISMSDPWF